MEKPVGTFFKLFCRGRSGLCRPELTVLISRPIPFSKEPVVKSSLFLAFVKSPARVGNALKNGKAWFFKVI
jgi:hypothetical protein